MLFDAGNRCYPPLRRVGVEIYFTNEVIYFPLIVMSFGNCLYEYESYPCTLALVLHRPMSLIHVNVAEVAGHATLLACLRCHKVLPEPVKAKGYYRLASKHGRIICK